jgi:hypothetical protein
VFFLLLNSCLPKLLFHNEGLRFGGGSSLSLASPVWVNASVVERVCVLVAGPRCRSLPRSGLMLRWWGGLPGAARSQELPGAARSQQGASHELPGAARNQPGAARSCQEPARSQPGASQELPGASQELPGAAKSQPGAARSCQEPYQELLGAARSLYMDHIYDVSPGVG